jgi:ABC-type lipoprotein release transport system permease subunit
VKPGVNHRAAFRSLSAILVKLGGNNNGAQAVPVQRPAQIINYGSLGSTPVVLGSALAVGAVVAMGLTLITSVRRRRRDLALLKILGFTRRQVAAAITWQSSVATAIGTVIGVPLGVVLGRFLWDLFAHEIYAVPSPDVPILSVALIVVSALVLANIVAAIPGRVAARTPTALLLRAE